MIAPNVGQVIASTWQDYVKSNPTDQIFDTFWLLDKLKGAKGFKKGSGTPINGPIEYTDNTTVKDMSELETLDVTRIDVFDQWEASWKFVGGDIVMSEYEKLVNEGGAAKFPLMAAKMSNLKKSMMRKLNRNFYSDGTGSGGKQMTGLAAIVSATPTTGTFEAINRATYTFWRNQQASGAKTTTAFDNLKSTMRSIYNLCASGVARDTPDFGVTDRASFEGYESLLTTNERLIRNGKNDKGISGYKGDQIAFKDIDIAYDADCTASAMYLLNLDTLYIRYLAWMKAYPPGTPVNQFLDVVKVLTIAQLCTDNPRRLGVITAIT